MWIDVDLSYLACLKMTLLTGPPRPDPPRGIDVDLSYLACLKMTLLNGPPRPDPPRGFSTWVDITHSKIGFGSPG